MSFLPDIIKKGWIEEEVFGICFESERERNRRRLQAIVCDHHLKQVKEFLLYNELAIWRRENGFNRVMEGKESCFYHVHRSLPPTPEEYYASLWLGVDALKDATSIPAESRPRQKDSMDELLAKFENAEIKRCMDKRCREEEQAEMTVKPVGTVQRYCSPCSPNPDMPSNAYVKLENNEGKMGQELEKLTSSSAGTGLETPGQQGPPNEGTLEQRQTTANGFLTAGVGSSKERNIATSTTTVSGISSIAATLSRRRLKTFNELNKRFDPGGREEKAPLWNAAVPLPFFSWSEAGRLLVCLSVAKLGGFLSIFSALCVFSRTYIFPFTDETYQRSCGSWTQIRSLMHATGAKAFFSPTTILKLARTSNAPFGRSANALG